MIAHRHRVATASDAYGYTHCVAHAHGRGYCRPEAHGGVVSVERCGCGAHRHRASTGTGRREYSSWTTDHAH